MLRDDFQDLDALLAAIREDKEAKEDDVSTRNRYPIRFVMFDNFKDSYQFTLRMIQENGIAIKNVQDWIDKDYPDSILTQYKLTNEMSQFIRSLNGKDMIITPFSELARFYDNIKDKEFDSLIKTIKAIETNDDGWNNHQRIYLPIVGLEGKMSSFYYDNQTTIWHMHSSGSELYYHLILTNDTTYGIENLDNKYTIHHNVLEWLDYWRQPEDVKTNIICTSKSLFANSNYAQPDNAFTYCTCNNVYEFITKGLGITFPGLQYRPQDEPYWQAMASEIDLQIEFDFDVFFSKHFSINSLDGYKAFIKIWFEYSDDFSRWLLVNTYKMRFDSNDYLNIVLNLISDFSNANLFSCIALNLPEEPSDIKVRRYCLSEAAKRLVQLPEETQNKLRIKLEKIANDTSFNNAIKYFTPISYIEKELAIIWLGHGEIKREALLDFYSDLYYYLEPSIGTLESEQRWTLDYINRYKAAKIADKYSDEVSQLIKERNGNQVEFIRWYNQFKTTRSIMQSRGDIDVYYWIDGLGIDWIPFIAHLIEEKTAEKVFLNDVKIARSMLPSVTSINKFDLEKLQKEGVTFEKLGDIDKMAHETTNLYPKNLINEIEIVKKAINSMLQLYSGKKIAIVSDHGISYLSQKQSGLNLSGFEQHHHGRYAIRKNEHPTVDSNYHILDDGETVCALNHHSLGAKIQSGLGAHGGCTPEEVLVPILIISSSPNQKTWNLIILNDEVSGTDPVVHMEITGLTALDVPKIIYNDKIYNVKHISHNRYESDPIDLSENCDSFELRIGKVSEIKRIPINLGSQEEDLFDDFDI